MTQQMVTAPWHQLMEDFTGNLWTKWHKGARSAEIRCGTRPRVDGRDAVAKGLVDELGGLQRALEVAPTRPHRA